MAITSGLNRLPQGSYDVYYYSARGGWHELRGADSDVSVEELERIAAKLKSNEALLAVCASRTGVSGWAYGSRAAQIQHELHEAKKSSPEDHEFGVSPDGRI